MMLRFTLFLSYIKQGVLWGLLITIFTVGVLKEAKGQHFNFRSISVEEGLPRSGAYSLLQDKDGFLWVTLDGGGVARFDGVHFITFDLKDGLPSRKVRDILQDKAGDFWLATSKGIAKLSNGKIIKVYTTTDGLPHNYTRTLTQTNEGELIVGTNKGLAVFDAEQEKWTPISIHDTTFTYKVRAVYNDSLLNTVWAGTEDGVYRIVNGKLSKWKMSNQLPSKRILSFLRDSKNRFWIGTSNGLVKFENDTFIVYDSVIGLSSKRVRAICEDNKGDIWIGTRTGVSRYDRNGFLPFSKENGLSHERIRDIIADNNGTLWFATYYGGINNFNPNDYITYTTHQGLVSNQILSLCQLKDSAVLAGTFDGLSVFKLKQGFIDSVLNLNSLNGLPHNRIYSLFNDSHKKIWIGTKKGIAITDNNFSSFQVISTSSGLSGSEIYAVLQENSTTYWVGTDEGINKVSFTRFPDVYNVSQHNDVSLESFLVSSIAKDSYGNIWFAYRYGGIRIKLKKGGFITPNFNEKIENITSLVSSYGRMYITTDANGFFIVDDFDFNHIISAQHISKESGLTSNNIYALAVDATGKIRCGNERGIDVVRLNDSAVLDVEFFGNAEGIEGGEIIEKSILFTNTGTLLLGTVNGLASSSPFHYKTNYLPPILQILSVESYDIDKTNRKIWRNYKNIEIPYSQNNIALDFIGIDLNRPRKVRYKWFLEGLSKHWSAPSNRSYLTFTNLPPQKYTLKLLSSNNKGKWNLTPITISFTVLPPFWMEWWFIILVVVLIILIVLLVVRWKINQLIKQKEILENKIKKATLTIEQEKEYIELQNQQIFEQKNVLEEQHKEIKESIDYAQLIQEASLPENKITDFFKDAFLLYRPRDVVSGDFYWWQQQNDFILFCVADSTGHGIPGAFISLIGTILSNEIFYEKKLLHPNEILDELNKKVQFTLEQHHPNPKIKDGMDLSFCTYNKKTKKLYFSGANNPVWIVRHSENPLFLNGEDAIPSLVNEESGSFLYEIKGDKQPIGLHAKPQHPFTLHEAQLQVDDEIYLFTDGYADQFGGERDKKFMSKRFKKLLLSNKDLPMRKVEKQVELNFITWKGKNEQVDDVCVVGIRVSDNFPF